MGTVLTGKSCSQAGMFRQCGNASTGCIWAVRSPLYIAHQLAAHQPINIKNSMCSCSGGRQWKHAWMS